MMLQGLLIGAASIALAAAPAFAADEAAPVATASQSTDAKIAGWLKDAPPANQADDTSGPEGPPPKPDGKIHGEVGAAIGTGGYRSAYGVVHIPIGATGSATIAVATGRGRGFGGPWLGGPDYGVSPLGWSRREGYGASSSCVRVYQQSQQADPAELETSCPSR